MYIQFKYFSVTVGGLFSSEMENAAWGWPKLADLFQHIWLPVLILAFGGTAELIRIMRANLLDELHKPYVTTARLKGQSEFTLLMRYPVRVALNPFVSTIGSGDADATYEEWQLDALGNADTNNSNLEGDDTTAAAITPIIWLRRWTRLRATALGWNPCSAIAASTAARVSGDTSGRLLITRETVWTDTPVMRAISLIVTLCWRGKLGVPQRIGRCWWRTRVGSGMVA